MAGSFVRLQPPMGGLDKRLSYQRQSPFTTPACSNVRPDETLLGRERLGLRPGLVKFSATQLGSGNPVRLVADVKYASSGAVVTKRVASSNGVGYWLDGATWTAMGGAVTFDSDRMLTAADHLQTLYIATSSAGAIVTFNPTTNAAAAIVASAGTAPTNIQLLAMWRDRLVAAGDESNPHLWYMSKSGDATNWDYAPATTTSKDAVSATTSDAGSIGEPITAMIPHTDECMIFGCSTSLWKLEGDPLNSGRITKLSDDIGVLDRMAWCYDPEGYLYFLSQDGLYLMPPGCGTTPRSVSREKLPEELLRIDRSLYTCSMAYDLRNRGVHIFVSKNSAATTIHYWIDVKNTPTGDQQGPAAASFWPESLASTDYDPFAIWALRDYTPTDTSLGGVVLGCRDGYTRQFDNDLKQDDGTNISSHFEIGPFALAGPGFDGYLDEIQVAVAASSGNINCLPRVGQNAEAAFNASAFSTFACNTAGLNQTHRPRARGGAALIRFASNENNTAWAVEDVVIRRSPAGPRRIL